MFVNKHFANFTVINSRILSIKKAKFSGYYFYMNTNIYGYFQICISVPLTPVGPPFFTRTFFEIHNVSLENIFS